MATTSEVKTGLDEIAKQIRDCRDLFERSKTRIVVQRSALDAIPTVYADVLDTIQLYIGTDAFEAVAKDELSKMTAEFIALRAEIEALIQVTEFGYTIGDGGGG